MNSQHTPGPWEAVPQHQGGPIIAHRYDTGQQMNPRGLRLVCHVLARGNSLAQDDANARLIAEAPAMYDTLKAIVDCYGVGSTPEKFCEYVRDFMTDAKEIVAKIKPPTV